jgi:hippurate hydrolase
MDALPITEATGLPWESRRPGIMHACGHDGHTAILLAAARRLAETARFDGTVHLIFQPAEEGGGGARRMMDQGLFERFPCDAVFALHNMPGIRAGQFVFRDGPAMASSDYATIRLTGVGGHGAMPHRAADPIVAAASIVMALQTVVSRNVDPLHTAVVTVGALHAGQANNVIPAEAVLELTARALDPAVRRLLEARIRALVESQAASFGVQAEIDWRPGYPVLVNEPTWTERARQVARQTFGPGRVTAHGQALTGSEDFAFMLEEVPGSYLLVGNGDGSGGSGNAAAAPGACMVHNPGYDFNDAILGDAARFWVALVEDVLASAD